MKTIWRILPSLTAALYLSASVCADQKPAEKVHSGPVKQRVV
jgi:hypothetical protein